MSRLQKATDLNNQVDKCASVSMLATARVAATSAASAASAAAYAAKVLGDSALILSAEIALAALKECKSPGCEYLYLC